MKRRRLALAIEVPRALEQGRVDVDLLLKFPGTLAPVSFERRRRFLGWKLDDQFIEVAAEAALPRFSSMRHRNSATNSPSFQTHTRDCVDSLPKSSSNMKQCLDSAHEIGVAEQS